MLYCFNCREVYDLPFENLEPSRNPLWDTTRRRCPKKNCGGFVHVIDDDMVPILDAVLNDMERADFDDTNPFMGMTLHSCSGHWDEEIHDGHPSLPYLVIAVIPKGCNVLDMEYFSSEENRSEYYRSMSEFLKAGNYPEYADISVAPSTVMWDGFDDIRGMPHSANEGWIPITIGIDSSWVEENLPSVGKPLTEKIDALRRHYKYIEMFLEVLSAFRNRLMELWSVENPEED